MKDVYLRVVDNKLEIDGIIFEHSELREAKEYMQSVDASEAIFMPEDDDEVDALHEIVIKMGELSPEASGEENSGYFLN
mgnify:CR=1 FL=1|tara:strand:+ start:405 stop:641 length:237 start_codon:yes stop_codon:yes gene_type:complete